MSGIERTMFATNFPAAGPRIDYNGLHAPSL
jgi:hypothetical protein